MAAPVDLTAYWKGRLAQRMDDFHEVNRLLTALKGCYYEHLVHDPLEPMKLSEWLHTKRPFGSKAVDESIAYNLGWDTNRILCTSEMPEFVRKEARILFDMLHTQLLKDEENI